LLLGDGLLLAADFPAGLAAGSLGLLAEDLLLKLGGFLLVAFVALVFSGGPLGALGLLGPPFGVSSEALALASLPALLAALRSLSDDVGFEPLLDASSSAALGLALLAVAAFGAGFGAGFEVGAALAAGLLLVAGLLLAGLLLAGLLLAGLLLVAGLLLAAGLLAVEVALEDALGVWLEALLSSLAVVSLDASDESGASKPGGDVGGGVSIAGEVTLCRLGRDASAGVLLDAG